MTPKDIILTILARLANARYRSPEGEFLNKLIAEYDITKSDISAAHEWFQGYS